MKSEELAPYYDYVYPFQTLVKWLTYNDTVPLNRRQLSFEFQNGIVQRYVTFNNAKEMKERMTNRHQERPMKVDAGAIWSEIPKKDSPGRTQQRELVFDFDMNDYDDVRNCCQGKNVCVRCWKLLIIAIQIIKKTLQEDFDLHQFMFVFSGGRGIHIWVCDKRARKLKDSVRKSIVDYLELVTGNNKAESLLTQNSIKQFKTLQFFQKGMKAQNIDQTDRKQVKKYMLDRYVHHQVKRSLEVMEKQNWFDIFKDQQALQHEKGIKIIQKILKNRSEKLKDRVSERWEKTQDKSTSNMYEEMLKQIKHYEECPVSEYPLKGNAPKDTIKNLTFIEQQIMLSFLYPRMDYNVSTMQNHLLKLPFSVHPSKRRVSVPMFQDTIRDFDPKNQNIDFDTLMKDIQELAQQCGYQNLNPEQVMTNCSIFQYIRAMKDFIDKVCASQKNQ